MAQKHTTRPAAVAPAGRVTVAQAAETLGMSYSGVYRHVQAGTVDCEQDASGVITIARADLGKIRKAQRKPAAGDNQPIMIRPPKASVEKWQRHIARTTKPGEKPVAVSRWLLELAEAAAS